MIPVFVLFREMGWIDTFWPLIVPAWLASPFFVFMFRQFFSQIPEELIEAARIDGASSWTIYWRMMLPLSGPVIAIVAIYSFLGAWNDFMGPLIYLNPHRRIARAGVGKLQCLQRAIWGQQREFADGRQFRGHAAVHRDFLRLPALLCAKRGDDRKLEELIRAAPAKPPMPSAGCARRGNSRNRPIPPLPRPSPKKTSAWVGNRRELPYYSPAAFPEWPGPLMSANHEVSWRRRRLKRRLWAWEIAPARWCRDLRTTGETQKT